MIEQKKDKISTEEVKKIEEKVSEQSKKNNRILGGFLVVILLVVAMFVGFSISKDTETQFSYKNVDFQVTQEIAPYKTTLITKVDDPVTGAATSVPYSYYLRKDPRETVKNVPFEGSLTLMKLVVLTTNESFNCEGMGPVGVMNMARLLQSIGSEVVADENATCDPEGRYLHVELVVGDETKIKKIQDHCFIMYINDCEILEATERFMIESLVEANKYLDSE